MSIISVQDKELRLKTADLLKTGIGKQSNEGPSGTKKIYYNIPV
jgi:hypothetical protein